ncbi:MAG: translocation/assembly module TamB [Sphingobacteriaceae bacterium]|nr:translocation/assembly module TamB [Sphingobacteriaceae bacterium]
MSKELKTRIEINSLYVKPFKSIVLKGLYVEDHEKDTLLYSPRFTVDIDLFSMKLRKINLNTVQMDNGQFYLKDYKDGSSNLDFIINYFNAGTTKPTKPKGKPYEVTFNKVVLNNIKFKYRNFKYNDKVDGVDFNDIALQNLNTTISGFNTRNHLASFHIENLTLREKSGFYLKNLTADANIDSNALEFENLLLETNRTRIRDYVQFKFNEFNDFNHFVKKVYVKAILKNSRINARDIGLFIPEINTATFDVLADGTVSGYVDNFKARNFSVRTGQATYLKGDFKITGLPKLSETFLDLDFDQVYTNKKDAELIAKSFTGKTQKLPNVINKFGNISFKGRFTGFPKDFIAYGEFKTALGRVVSDVNMKIAGNVPVYSGTIKAYDFNLGELLDEKMLGRVSMSTSIKGTSFDLAKLRENINSNISYIDFKGYRYTNVHINGLFNRKMFNGVASVRDRNLNLDFKGSFDLNPRLPVFNFAASVHKANLHRLHLMKDTLQIEADFKTNFRGNNLDNIEGKLAIRKIRLTNPRQSFVVDSVYLTASGTGTRRLMVLNSDILDATIKGQYDLSDMPDYFKWVAKKHIPSLKTGVLHPGVQDFEIDVNVKYFEPLSLLLAPQLKIPDGATLHGKFQSKSDVATLNGSAKLIQYGNIKINNLIVDETNSRQALNIFVTSDRVDLDDSLYVKNVNIANFIQNDSLMLNVKLSDKDATNQLDLNGLVEFGRDTSAVLSLLPSDVVINRESWKIQEKVRIGFDNGKVSISNFQLFRDNQLLTIDGVISNDTEDHIKAEFRRFKLSTFNALTKSAGIAMSGELNGEISVAAAEKAPHMDADLRVDSMKLNNTLVGDVVFSAGFDNETKLVDAKAVVLKQGKETLNIAGTYNAKATENSLNMDVTMDESEIVIFEPFINKLVSNLKGTASANLKLTGTLLDPKINGRLKLNNAAMTVNYLKTPYRIDDEVLVENSVIRLNNLIIHDINNNEAIANGTVNMNDPNNPDIDVRITARNFMALNTTAKDNSLYYGTAYATGVFTFNGPTDNMVIDIDAKTEEGTVFNIPLNSASKVGDNEFITFVAKDSTLTAKKPPAFNGISMSFRLNVDEGSEVNIFTDLGKLSGRGNSNNLQLNITSGGIFEMFGTYSIASGQFDFTPKDFINKIFDITSGGSIKWNGDPTQAQINLTAVYSLRTSLRNLYIAAGRPPVDQVVLTEAVMTLTETLLHPKIALGIEFPSNAYVKDEIGSYFSDANNVNTQALNLIVRRNFSPGTGSEGLTDQISRTVQTGVTELFFNQVNNIISQSLGLNFVDLSIRSFNDASASFRLFNGRVILTGGVTDRRAISDLNLISSDITRDIEAQYLIKKDGSLSLKASNRLDNRNFLNLSQTDKYVNAIGLVYRQEFDNFNEFLKILIGQKRREDRQKEAPAQPAVAPPTTPSSPPTTSLPAKTGGL